MARGVDCTEPNDTFNVYPCLNCLSVCELWIVLTGLFANANGEAGDIDAVKVGGKKYKLLNDKKFLIALISTLPESFFVGLTADNIAQDFGCMRCWGESEVKAALINQWCTFWENYSPE